MNIYKNKLFIAFTAVISIAIGIGLFYTQHANRFDPHKMEMTVLHNQRALKPFKLIQANGKPFTEANLKGKWNVIFFGFTRCGMMCPTTMAKLNKIQQSIEKQHSKLQPQIIMVTIDPKHDTAKRVDAYAKGFNKNFIGLGGSEEQIAKLTKQLGIAYFTIKSNQNQHTTINHSGALTIVNPEGKVFGFYTAPQSIKKVAHDIVYMGKTLV